MKEFTEALKKVPGVITSAIIDKDGIVVTAEGDSQDDFVVLIPFINRMKEALVNLGGTLDELVINKGKEKILMKEKDGLFFCVLYSPENGGYDGRIKHHLEKVLMELGV